MSRETAHADEEKLRAQRLRCRRFERLEDRQVLAGQTALITDAAPYNAAFIDGVYQDALGRSADPAAMNWAMQQLNEGQLRLVVPLAAVSSDEYLSNLVRSAYQQYLGRDVDPAALTFWVGQLHAGVRNEDLAAALVASDEFYVRAGGTDADWANAAYQALLGRPAEASALAWATDQLAAGGERGGLAMRLAESLEREQEIVRDDYAHFMNTAPDAGGLGYWSTELANGQTTQEGLLTSLMGADAYYREKAGVSPTVVPMPVDNAAWEARDAQINSQAAAGNAQIVFLGDSITEYWNDAGKTVWAQNYAGSSALNAGIAGDRTQNVLWRLDHGSLDGLSPKFVVVMIGINNLALGDSPQDVFDGVAAIVATLRQRLPETKVLVLGILPGGSPDPNSPLRQEIADANQKIQTLTDGQNVFYLDLGPAFTNADGTIKPELYQPYFVHLNAAGYAVWARTMAPDVQYLGGWPS